MLIRKKLKNYKNINLNIGDKFKFPFYVSEKIHRQFAEFTGDKSPIHRQKKFYNKYGYKKKLGYGFLITSVLSQIYGMFIPGGNELCLRQTCNFKKPFFVGERLNVNIIITYKNNNLKLLSVFIKVLNQKKVCVFDGEATFKLLFT